jgi:very-short-patch-repair endonuclease
MQKVDRIITGQSVSPAKLQRTKELRQNMTPAEKVLWQYLRANRLNGLHFRRQQIIDGFIVDFYCHAARLVIELDGEVHQQQVESDAERDAILQAKGLKLLRFPNEVVLGDINTVLLTITTVCDLSLPASLSSKEREE